MRICTLILLTALLFDSALVSEALAQNGNPGWWNGNDTQPFAGGVIRDAYCDIIGHVEGEFGGLLMVIAGILAFGAAAFGDFKHGITLLVTGIGAFTVSALVSLYFGQLCGGQTGARTAQTTTAQSRSTNLDAAFAIGAGKNVNFGDLEFQDFGEEENQDPFN